LKNNSNMGSSSILVYVQAMPVKIHGSVKNFLDLVGCDFRMTHGSKAALYLASMYKGFDIVATGFGPILNESLARGATRCIEIALCDNPRDQAKEIPPGEWRFILVGENPDAFFAGASLCGSISSLFNCPVFIFDWNRNLHEIRLLDYPKGSVVLVRDTNVADLCVDARRVSSSSQTVFEKGKVVGSSSLELKQPQEIGGLVLDKDTRETAILLSKKLRKYRDRNSSFV
jgi:hypothetical protein